ncbi:hypothetical protein EGW08_003238 [Elysia chlorotica]|uniref:MARVEL domain-containing protein n=1 Tax=Elysia chlorotica TaxID=188477 RepID=A0A3S1BQD8_ELYCH|nr:hypothetical protein EGW08_003238 [Elysia chlorotica]
MAGKCCCGTGCNLRVFLVVVLMLTASAIIAVSVFTILYVPAIKMTETPVWAGGPLLLAALFSTAYCCPGSKSTQSTQSHGERRKHGQEETGDEEGDEESLCVFIVKVMCIVFLAISFIVCLIAAVFCAVHIVQIFTFASCRSVADGCVCFRSKDADTKRTVYSPVENCDEVFCKVTYTIMASGSLCLAGSLAAIALMASVFRSRYGHIDGDA